MGFGRIPVSTQCWKVERGMPSCLTASASQTNLAITHDQLKDCLILPIDFEIYSLRPLDLPKRGAAALASGGDVEALQRSSRCWIQRSRMRGLLLLAGLSPPASSRQASKLVKRALFTHLARTR